MPTPIRIPFPVKGVNRNFARSDQNGVQQGLLAQFLPETCYDAMNVVPYDRFDRLRGGSRFGTGKISPQFNNSLIQLAQGVAVAGIPGFSGNIFSDAMAYSSGQALSTANSAYICNSGVTGDGGTALAFNNTGTTTLLQTTGTSVTQTVTTTASVARYTTPLTLGNIYDVSITATGSIGAVCFATAMLGNVAGTAGNNAVQARFSWAGSGGTATLEVVQGSTTIATTNITESTNTWVLGGSTVVMSIQIAGTVATATVTSPSGAQSAVASGTITSNANTQVGFGISDVTGTAHTTSVVNFSVSGPAPVSRTPLLIVICNGLVYQGIQTNGVFSFQLAAGQSSTLLSTSAICSMAIINGFGYIVDGNTILKYNLGTNAVAVLTATAGSLPVQQKFCVAWRGRLVLYGDPLNPQNFYMSRIGVPSDFDYSQIDAAAAFEGSAAVAGYIGEPLTAMMPFTDDVMLIGGDHNLWRIAGDPLQNGTIDIVSNGIGVLSNTGWTMDDAGIIYFLGTGGLYSISPNGQPTNMTQTTYDLALRGVDSTVNYINLAWNQYQHGFFIFISPSNTTTQGTSFFYDKRNAGLWPIQFPVIQGPSVSGVFLGDAGIDYVFVLGGYDGYLRSLSFTNLDDDGTPISSYMVLGPFQPNTPSGDAVINGMDITLGENVATDSAAVFNCSWLLKGGKSAFEVTESATPRYKVGGTFTYPGWQLTRVQRIRGGWYTLTMSNAVDNTYWSMEHAVLHVEPQGKQR